MNDVRLEDRQTVPRSFDVFRPRRSRQTRHQLRFPKAIDVEIYGYDFEKARDVIARVKEIMEQTPGLADIEPSREENYPEVNVTVDREKAALLGISEPTG